ncbi:MULTISPECIES: hypothetical protein [unclassified Pantoea]|uniref:hypothetical protein n=1 Tax=unclassified Pantoea TaxID=2630326 RepID=UPI0021180208|nr:MULTISPECIES: hypothetical protein [unclassified Pantoea]
MLNVLYVPLIHRFDDDIGSSGKELEKLDELKAWRDNLVTKVAIEFTQAEKYGDWGEYRLLRAKRMIKQAA